MNSGGWDPVDPAVDGWQQGDAVVVAGCADGNFRLEWKDGADHGMGGAMGWGGSSRQQLPDAVAAAAETIGDDLLSVASAAQHASAACGAHGQKIDQGNGQEQWQQAEPQKGEERHGREGVRWGDPVWICAHCNARGTPSNVRDRQLRHLCATCLIGTKIPACPWLTFCRWCMATAPLPLPRSGLNLGNGPGPHTYICADSAAIDRPEKTAGQAPTADRLGSQRHRDDAML